MRQLLDGLMAASLRAGVEPPPLYLGAFGLLDPAAFSPILQGPSSHHALHGAFVSHHMG